MPRRTDISTFLKEVIDAEHQKIVKPMHKQYVVQVQHQPSKEIAPGSDQQCLDKNTKTEQEWFP